MKAAQLDMIATIKQTIQQELGAKNKNIATPTPPSPRILHLATTPTPNIPKQLPTVSVFAESHAGQWNGCMLQSQLKSLQIHLNQYKAISGGRYLDILSPTIKALKEATPNDIIILILGSNDVRAIAMKKDKAMSEEEGRLRKFVQDRGRILKVEEPKD